MYRTVGWNLKEKRGGRKKTQSMWEIFGISGYLSPVHLNNIVADHVGSTLQTRRCCELGNLLLRKNDQIALDTTLPTSF